MLKGVWSTCVSQKQLNALQKNCKRNELPHPRKLSHAHIVNAPCLWFVLQTWGVRVWHPSRCGGEAWTEGVTLRGRTASSGTAPKGSPSPSAGWVMCTCYRPTATRKFILSVGNPCFSYTKDLFIKRPSTVSMKEPALKSLKHTLYFFEK